MASNMQAVAKRMGKNVRRILIGLLLTGWTAGWGMVSLVGWAASSPAILYAGVSMMAAGLLGSGAAYTVGRRRLQAQARTSLIARAELEQLQLSDGMEARLHLFDDAWLQLESALSDPSLPHADRSAEVTAELNRAQGELFQIAQRQAVVAKELAQLGLYASSDLVEASKGDKRAELERLDAGAEELVKETRALASTAEQVRALASGRSSEAAGRLKDAVSQFNLTLSAYKEVEAETKALQDGVRRAAAKAQQSQQT